MTAPAVGRMTALAKQSKDWLWGSWSFYFTEGRVLIGIDAVDL